MEIRSPGSATGPIRSHKSPIAKRACDQCKFRKIKCSLSQPCKACESMGFDCTFLQPQKKRGPTGHRVSQIRQQQTVIPTQESKNGFQFQAPSSSVESGQALPRAPWGAPTHGPATMPLEGAGLAPAGIPPPMAAWGEETPSIDSHNSGLSWNDRNDVEYWLPDNLDAQVPIFDLPGSNVYLRPSLPSIIQPVPDAAAAAIGIPQEGPNMAFSPTVRSMRSDTQETDAIWPSTINEANIIPWIDVYFDRLHPTIPVLNRSSLYTSMITQEHRKNSQFGAMLLSLCAFSLTQPIEINERPTSSSRALQARAMMNAATKMRSCSDFGENPTIEAVLTSFFLFGCLFGSNQHNAAWLRIREALDLAATLGLNDPESYQDLSGEEKGQRLRTYLVLSITERAYALQRRHPITFWGKPGFTMRSVHDFIHSATHSVVSGIVVHNEKDAEGMMGLARMMELFDAIDEDVIDCWNRRCDGSNGYCQRLTAVKALSIHQNLNRVNQAERYRGYDWFERAKEGRESRNVTFAMGLRETQAADVFITQKWLQNRVWLLSSTHGLLSAHSEQPELSFGYAVSVAESTLRLCQSLRLSSMEAHGIGLTEKLYDIAICATNILCNTNPSYGIGLNMPVNFPEIIPTTTTSTAQSLAEDFLLLMTSFRGGNHPYLEKYRAHLRSLQIMEPKAPEWAQ
ncbi:transcriptional regulator family: Fungal Specific TF [Penicillium roqueforti]|uniref:Zn(2)-C6 fungal-type DNA-binding domain n=1 Tax=Penicillium roqueforti (strain FM164) TaxID=1365484 RepID=W6QL89_PENRF|nr:transcriptional regulator family: Fungal Specific TF [Penicillium roqueforti]CDM37613.1 Zn(2)-C6 fungal-type DNA-binding domain [Penicillium roqueforti FM164]KAF9239748.1 transcriptional regulator family: Fungal Specific TF [Penicillium roqueforti]KAI1829777.1 transcriptional regulator family: Fungal Specific TF [Penicillium roqueforti]KAI2670221.1 transcriptional regulator family: Fungal Specific TF [Penicillium roqueforti]KAI2672521.1 transcriptional regulator family: Fungal Specific TF [